MNLHVSGACLYNKDNIIAFTPTDFPDPVVPATSKWGIADKSATTGVPAMFFPKQIGSLNFEFF